MWRFNGMRMFAIDEDLRSKLQDMDTLQDSIRQQTKQRAAILDEALVVADKFSGDYQDAIRALRDIQDNILSQDSPGVDPMTVREQERELQVINNCSDYTQAAVVLFKKNSANIGLQLKLLLI